MCEATVYTAREVSPKARLCVRELQRHGERERGLLLCHLQLHCYSCENLHLEGERGEKCSLAVCPTFCISSVLSIRILSRPPQSFRVNFILACKWLGRFSLCVCVYASVCEGQSTRCDVCGLMLGRVLICALPDESARYF